MNAAVDSSHIRGATFADTGFGVANLDKDGIKFLNSFVADVDKAREGVNAVVKETASWVNKVGGQAGRDSGTIADARNHGGGLEI